MTSASKIVLGIDGGGTKTIAWLADASDFAPSACQNGQGCVLPVIGSGEAGASNCRSVGLELATRHLQAAIDAAFRDAEIDFQTVDAACFALAGADREIERDWVQNWAGSRQIARHVHVCNDAIPLLYATSVTGPAVAVIAGTGSLAVGRGRAGQIIRCGGWGGLIGDEGSGYRIAIDALQAASRHDDHRGPKTELHTAFLERFAITDLSQMIPILYGESFRRGDIAQLAPLVFRVAEEGDLVAKKIITDAAVSISELIITTTNRIDANDVRLPLGLAGGVLIHQPEFVQTIAELLSAAGLPQTVMQPIEQPVRGAVRLAALRSCESK